MLNDVRLEFDVKWSLNIERVARDPLNNELKTYGRYIPYRVYLVPSMEMLCERVFDIQDWYYIHEMHQLQLEHGQWALSIHEPTGMLDVVVKDFRLNTVRQPGDSTVFTL